MNGETLQAIRIYLRLSQKQFARELGISAPYLCEMEKGKRPVTDFVRKRVAQYVEINDHVIEAIRRTKLASKLGV